MSNRWDDWEGQYLCHHGIKGQKWGVRRFQNEDGTLTTIGKLRASRERRKDRTSQKHDQKENYKRLKAAGKKQDFNEVLKTLPNKDMNKLVKAIDKEEIAYLSGKKKYSDHVDTPSRKIKGEIVRNYIGRYGHKKVYGPNGIKQYATNAVHRLVSNAADREAYGGNYDEFLKKYAKKRG